MNAKLLCRLVAVFASAIAATNGGNTVSNINSNTAWSLCKLHVVRSGSGANVECACRFLKTRAILVPKKCFQNEQPGRTQVAFATYTGAVTKFLSETEQQRIQIGKHLFLILLSQPMVAEGNYFPSIATGQAPGSALTFLQPCTMAEPTEVSVYGGSRCAGPQAIPGAVRPNEILCGDAATFSGSMLGVPLDDGRTFIGMLVSKNQNGHAMFANIANFNAVITQHLSTV